MRKIIILAVTTFLSLNYNCFAQSDTVLIKLKSGKVEKIPVLNIKKITFDGLTSVKESETTQSQLIV